MLKTPFFTHNSKEYKVCTVPASAVGKLYCITDDQDMGYYTPTQNLLNPGKWTFIEDGVNLELLEELTPYVVSYLRYRYLAFMSAQRQTRKK